MKIGFFDVLEHSWPTKEKVDLRTYNCTMFKEKYVAHINEFGQVELRKVLIELMKQQVHAWSQLDAQEVLKKTKETSSRNEKLVLETLISNSEETPIFDFETPFY